MTYLPVDDLFRSQFRGASGAKFVMALAECFFDDSGTDRDSPVVTWGGLIGLTGQWDFLDKKWRALLAEPLPGKPPLKSFHLSHCAALDGEFSDYKRAESDRVRFLFREIIALSGVESYSYSVSKIDYFEIMPKEAIKKFGGPSQVAVSGCISKSIIRANECDADFFSIIFDRGAVDSKTALVFDRVQKEYIGESCLVGINSMKVSQSTGLQAADTIATEAYWSAKRNLNKDSREYSEHVKSMLGKIEIIEGYILEKKHITKMASEYRQLPRNYFDSAS